jgi:ubiquinone/menaquinone biosynthesis C-methylase UbiE
MLSRARLLASGAAVVAGDLHHLPLPDDMADVVVTGLALTHVADLGPVFTEFARVLRPEGHLIVSDVHHDLVLLARW